MIRHLTAVYHPRGDIDRCLCSSRKDRSWQFAGKAKEASAVELSLEALANIFHGQSLNQKGAT